MASLSEQFQHYYVPGDDAVENAIKTGMIVPDTNVLLSLYRFQSGARENLFQALETAADRLWIPHQVGFEFHERRLDVMRDQEAYFSGTQADLDKLVDAVQGRVRNFRARIGLSRENLQEIEDGVGLVRDRVAEAIKKAEEANEVRLSGHSSDDILIRILEMFPDGRLGDPMESKEHEEACKEAERRKQPKIPPGYKDKGPGDYLVWRQLMNEAKQRKLPVVLVTDDRKEDWYWIYDGKTLGARRELRKEIMDEAGVPLFMMTTETFLRHAETYLGVSLDPETVDQVSIRDQMADALAGWKDGGISFDVYRYRDAPELAASAEDLLAGDADLVKTARVVAVLPRTDRELITPMLAGLGIPLDVLEYLLNHPGEESFVLPQLLIALGVRADELWESAQRVFPRKARRIAQLVIIRLVRLESVRARLSENRQGVDELFRLLLNTVEHVKGDSGER